MRRAALIVLITAVYVGCARKPPSEPAVPPVTEPLRGGTLRLALSTAELNALARYGLVANTGAEAAFVADRIDRWRRLAPSTLLDHVEFVSDDKIPRVELLLLGEVDLTPVYGRELARVREDAGDEIRVVRAPGWDRTYVIHCDTRSRWTNDPNFRRWFAETVDRVDLVGGLFDGFAAPVWSIQPRSTGPLWAPPIRHPFGSTSRPLLHLKFESDDVPAAAIASRLKARFAAEGVELELLTSTDRVERPALTLSGRQRWSADPVATIEPLVVAAGGAAEGSRHYLGQAKSVSGETRTNLATLAEDALLIDALVVPLVRLEAWVAMSSRLRGVGPGLTGELALEKTWWGR